MIEQKLCATERLVLLSLAAHPHQGKEQLRANTGAGHIGIHNALRTLHLMGRIAKADDSTYALVSSSKAGE